jgi:uncharacterized protein YndB with AHSA1/START domain
MKATPKEVFEALTNPQTIQEWSGGPAKMDDKVGTEFSLFGGSIYGVNLEVTPNQKLVQEWYHRDNPKNPTRVAFTLAAAGDGAKVELLHENIPDDEVTTLSEGWDKYYLGQIQKMFAGSKSNLETGEGTPNAG